MKSFHQKECENVFHRDINIGLMGVKEEKKKKKRSLWLVFLIWERMTDTD